MLCIQAYDLTYTFSDGHSLFPSLSMTLDHSVVGLVGQNGSGKSILASLLTKEVSSTSGVVNHYGSVGRLKQLDSLDGLSSQSTICDFLGVREKLVALDRIEQGQCYPEDFACIGDDWGLKSDLIEQLKCLGLPSDPYLPCHLLSGGQITRLALYQLFQSNHDFLILDEPSNHLDYEAKQWLIKKIKHFNGGVLLISHDRELLSIVDCVYALNQQGLTRYGGNYDAYERQHRQDVEALDNRIAKASSELKKRHRTEQLNREKAQQRAAKGKQVLRSGSQPKILQDAKKNKAERANAKHAAMLSNQAQRVQQTIKELKQQQDQTKPQYFSLDKSERHASTLLRLFDVRLAHVDVSALTYFLEYGDKVWLTGKNGSGKSTLLKSILGDVGIQSGEIQVNAQLCYLDQHFSLLDPTQSILNNVSSLCVHLSEVDIRTYLAGMGFRRDRVHLLVDQLSGGERMKVAMLIVSHQQGNTLLLLDEPDNHLDLDSKRLLAQMLCEHKGSFIMVSHDNYFADEAGMNRCLTLSDG